MRRARTLVVTAALGASVLGVVATAHAATGKLTYKGCISGATASGPDACSLIPGATAGGSLSGLDAVESVSVSPDGRHVYAVSRLDDSIALLKRDRKSGALTYKGCFTGDTVVGACDQTITATAGGDASGLDDVRAVAIAPGGDFAYAVSANDDAVARFKRHHNGVLEFQGCFSGDSATGAGGTDACAQAPAAAPGGANSGLDHPKSLAISGDGKSLYVASTEDAAIAQFKRDRDSGTLTYKRCTTGETESGSAGSGACTEIDADGTLGDNSGLDDPRGLALTPRGKALVGVSSDDDALFVFDRDRDNGRLAFDSCITGESETAAANPACDAFAATPGGADSGFDDTRSLAISRDGKSLYVVSRFDASVVHIELAGAEGVECYAADSGAAADDPCISIGTPTAGGADTGLSSAESAVLSRDGMSLYVSAANDAGVATFKRAGDGSLTFKGCITGDTNTAPPCREIPAATAGGGGSGLNFPQFIALSRDDRSLYVASSGDDAVATLKRKR